MQLAHSCVHVNGVISGKRLKLELNILLKRNDDRVGSLFNAEAFRCKEYSKFVSLSERCWTSQMRWVSRG